MAVPSDTQTITLHGPAPMTTITTLGARAGTRAGRLIGGARIPGLRQVPSHPVAVLLVVDLCSHGCMRQWPSR